MKITATHYQWLADKVQGAIDIFNIRHGIHPLTAYKDRGLSALRYRWDMLYRAKVDLIELYKYLNDEHIDTALRKITRTR